jgi:signal transduction histidine kinase
VWTSFALGRMQLPWVAQSVLLGGHVRVGLEDNLYLSRGVKATNAQLVERARTIIEAMGAQVATPDQAREILDKALTRTRTTIGELRDLSFNLEPVVLRDHGLSSAVAALTQDKGIEHGIQMAIDVTAAEVLGERAQAALYQIVREALEGAIRRGPPKTFSVRITHRREDDSLEVTVHDDAPGERRRRSIEALEERARTLHASLTFAHEDAGSTMRLVLPIYAGTE